LPKLKAHFLETFRRFIRASSVARRDVGLLQFGSDERYLLGHGLASSDGIVGRRAE
jgi:hypothetical protein